ncbi:GNAT family N-acetyltransferase [Scytonema sp. UIC 10036]|uniref:GNAT family N-acetyltransferase n=1 Tax=Scytonema sp. UIC 10036 TaxID=2304196 RepID=UPI0012DA6482|nr:GNAT family N-acetyltransferase [Scytonema sp. UIC 10036]MUH01781.1 GNAT family N-acetyltransferase [Scytonema sp. UIC 10036]
MYKLVVVDNPLAASFYEVFTFPVLRSKLYMTQREGPIVAVGANSNQKPIGLAMAEIVPNNQSNILSIFVDASHRNQGIGTALLEYLLKELKLRNCQSAQIIYVTGKPTTIALERILAKNNWTSPKPRMLVCNCDRQMLKAPWLQKEYPLATEFTIFPWTELTEQDRLRLNDRFKNETWIPELLNPLAHDNNFEPLNSIGLRYRDEVVGWIITHRLSPTTIRYTCSYIRPNLQRLGRILALYSESIKRQAANPDIFEAIWTVPFIYSSMIDFVKRRMANYMISIKESRESLKIIN